MPHRTKREIVSAFNRLVEKHGFDKTTVDMIVREAEISRATFYRYFKDKYEVMTYNYKNLIDANNNPETIQTLEDLFVIFPIGMNQGIDLIIMDTITNDTKISQIRQCQGKTVKV